MESLYGLKIIANIALNKAISENGEKIIHYYIKRTSGRCFKQKKLLQNCRN